MPRREDAARFRRYDPMLVNPEQAIPASEHSALSPGFPPLPTILVRPIRSSVVVVEKVEQRQTPAKLGSTADFLSELREGAYRVHFRPERIAVSAADDWPLLEGILRIETFPSGDWILMSGDLYVSDELEGSSSSTDSLRTIPSFPLHRYHSYLQSRAILTQSDQGKGRLTLLFGCHRIVSKAWNQWAPGTEVRLVAEELEPANESRSTFEKIVWGVIDEFGNRLGTMEWQWVSPFFREATIEIDCESQLAPPVADGFGNSIESVFFECGWQVRVETGRIETATPPTGQWTLAEIHDAMTRSRSVTDIDVDWQYHVTVVSRFAGVSPLGIAYDHEAGDLNGIPREDVAVQVDAEIPPMPVYGKYAGQRVSQCPELSMMIVLHELGHAMGLYHNHVGLGIMQQVDDMARSSRLGYLAPENLLPVFDSKDLVRLRHLPEIYIRPGGTDWEARGIVEDHNDALDRVESFYVPRALTEVEGPFDLGLVVVDPMPPLGAPVRIDYSLNNRSKQSRLVPGKFGLSTPFVSGHVVGPAGVINQFRSLFKSISAEGPIWLQPQMSLDESMTLLRGNRGALFPKPGRYSIWIEVEWRYQNQVFRARQQTKLQVLPAQTLSHDRVARFVNQTPELLGYLAVGRSQRFQAAQRVLDQVLAIDQLHSHYAYLMAREIGRQHRLDDSEWSTIRGLMNRAENIRPLSRMERRAVVRLLERGNRRVSLS